MLKMKMSYRDQSDWVPFVTKTRQDNDVIHHIGAAYVENNTKLSWPIKLGANYDEKHIGQLCY